MMKFETLILMVLCHLLGDYVLQSDYIAVTKGRNYYHLFVHSALYCLPFLLLLQAPYRAYIQIFTSHLLIDNAKARYAEITYVQDQILHYAILILTWPGMTTSFL